MRKIEEFTDNLLLFLHSIDTKHFSVFISFNNQDQYFFNVFSFPVLEFNQISDEKLSIFIKNNNLISKTFEISERNYSLTFLHSKDDNFNENLYNFLFSAFKEYIINIDHEQCKIIRELYDFTLHEIIKEGDQKYKLDNYFQNVLNVIATYFEAISGSFNLMLMFNNDKYEYNYKYFKEFDNNSNNNKTVSSNSTTDENKEKKNVSEIKQEEKKTEEKNTPKNTNVSSEFTYKVQIASSPVKPSETAYSNAGEVEIIFHNGMYKVISKKEFTSKDEALQYREQLIQKGYAGAFLVKYQNGKRVN